MSFVPQAMLMVICMNRMIFLRDAEHIETDYYRNLVPEAAFMHGNSEIFRRGGAGGEMHSALIAVGFREGSDMTGARSLIKLPFDENNMARDTVIPLDLRLMSFMKAVTGDLERATEELMQLKNNLEDEVEKKTRENEGLSLHVVQTLADAIDAKDTYTNGHSGRVADYSREIARRYGYSEKAQNEIYMMGLLHDVGKIGVPDAVINKPGRLTDEEFAEMKKHPVMGAKILGNIEERPELVTGARWHHERWDGRGYPDGISGMDIPEQARIIAVADAYDAMTSNRSYRGAMEQSKVRGQIEGGRGSQFDERFADIMLQMIDEDTEYDMREK
jgi:HD-GYP domain-containing protein (c-di-GMP phosphodiesterase class II)